jgi:chorismate mutase
MQTITIEITNARDRKLIQMLAKRLGLKWFISPEKSINDLSEHLATIDAGLEASPERMEDMLSQLKEGRQDRSLPFRSE